MTPERERSGGMRAETPGRRALLRRALAEKGADAVVLDRRDDQYYFTGYTGSDAVLVLAAGRDRGWLVTDSRYREEAEKTAPGIEILLWKGRFPGFVGSLAKKHRFRTVAFTPHSMTAAFFQSMRDKAGDVGDWPNAGPDIGRLRAVKSRREVEAVRRALACAEAAFLASRRRWKIGMTEMDVRNDLEWEMRRRGAEDAAFETIVAAGANASLPHAHAGPRKIAAGRMLLVDFGARVHRYNSDSTRTLWAGSVPRVWEKRYRAVLAARRAGFAAIRAGVPAAEVDRAARRALAEEGLAERFTHSLGHGVGLAVHEEPRLSGMNKAELAAGNLITVEPGLYFPGAGGIRVEDMALVEADGARVLGSLPERIEDMVI